MVRTSLLSLALFVLAGTSARPADEPKASEKEGVRVYTVTLRCQTRVLVGTYATAEEALRVAAHHRGKLSAQRVEVTTGSEGKQRLTGAPEVYHVYTRGCSRSQWLRQEVLARPAQIEEAIKKNTADGREVEIVFDYAPKEVFHVYGVQCRGTPRLVGTYLTVREACEGADRLRKDKNLRCEVTTGTKGQEQVNGSPVRYAVYALGCRGGWAVVATTEDAKKAMEIGQSRKKETPRVEIVSHYATK